METKKSPKKSRGKKLRAAKKIEATKPLEIVITKVFDKTSPL